ncbi:vacuolar-sorting protein SNF7 [Mycena amicta]|nr:vacuolar-sorting protein SNF7 [Mycena amicta]
MAGIMSYFGKKNTTQATREAIVALRQQSHFIEKKNEYLQKEIDQELKVAKANAISNKPLATLALKRKRAKETQLEQFRGQHLQISAQIDTLESANLNAATMAALKNASEVLKQIQGNMTVDVLHDTMSDIHEQREVSKEITDLISNPIGLNDDLSDEDLARELAELEEEVLTDRLIGANPAPLHLPPGAILARDDEEEAMLRQMQAEMAM